MSWLHKHHAYPEPPEGIVPEGELWAASAILPVGLRQIVESEIVPRLFLTSRPGWLGAISHEGHGCEIGADEPQLFAQMALRGHVYSLIQKVEILLAAGVTPQSIFLELVSPAAHHVNARWKQDACSFADVTMGLWRLQEVISEVEEPISSAVFLRGSPPGFNHALEAGAVDHGVRFIRSTTCGLLT